MTDAPRETVALRKTDARLAERSGRPCGHPSGANSRKPRCAAQRACPEGGAACACTDIQPAGDARRAAQRRGDTNNRRNRQKSRLVHRFLPEKRLRAETRTAKAQFAKNRDAIRARKPMRKTRSVPLHGALAAKPASEWSGSPPHKAPATPRKPCPAAARNPAAAAETPSPQEGLPPLPPHRTPARPSPAEMFHVKHLSACAKKRPTPNGAGRCTSEGDAALTACPPNRCPDAARRRPAPSERGTRSRRARPRTGWPARGAEARRRCARCCRRSPRSTRSCPRGSR